MKQQNKLMAALLVLTLAGCGGGATNDQGTSFTALGFFVDGDGAAGDNGTVVRLNEDVAGSQGVFPLFVPVDKDSETAGVQGGFIGVQNNLTAQFIRTVRADCSYVVPGASVSIPSDSFAFTTVLDAAPDAAAGDGGGDTGSGESTNTAYAQIEIVSPDVMQYLNNNINSLPALPFRMTAICTVIGISQAGDVFETNPVYYTIQFAEPSDAATDNGEGTGGDFDSFDGVTDDVTEGGA